MFINKKNFLIFYFSIIFAIFIAFLYVFVLKIDFFATKCDFSLLKSNNLLCFNMAGNINFFTIKNICDSVGLQNINFFDIAAIVFLLIFTIMGLYRGFVKSIINLLGGAISLIVAYFLCDKMTAFLNSVFSLDANVFNRVSTALGSVSEKFLTLSTDVQELNFFVESSSLGTIMKKLIQMYISSQQLVSPNSVVGIVASPLSALICSCVGFLICFVIIKIIVLILGKILSKIFEGNVMGSLNRFLGLLLGAFKGSIIIVGLLCLLNLLEVVPSFAELLSMLTQSSSIIGFFNRIAVYVLEVFV